MQNNQALLIFPHQLFEGHPGLELSPERAVLIEDSLFFGDRVHPAQFHLQKLWLHRASMKRYAAWLDDRVKRVDYREHTPEIDVLSETLDTLAEDGIESVVLSDPHDHLLERRLRRHCKRTRLEVKLLGTPMFLNTSEDNQAYRKTKKRWFMADFYKHQRRRLDVLMDGDEPMGERWSFDEENRKKVPKALLKSIPEITHPTPDAIDEAARTHVLNRYPKNPGRLEELVYPTSHEAARQWLGEFVEQRLTLFGTYEDAIVKGESHLWHGVLTPMLNIGLLTPREVLETCLDYANRHEVPINSLEGFVRQVIGWREFMRATYEDLGVRMRTTNHWKHTRSIPDSFYDGTTGIDPVDDAIHRVLETGYCHHIERLMVLGGFMFLCEFDPDEIYRWFMELFIDSYDWVMVPNVYAMSQHADGGLITTKPYFSGSSYIKKMSNHPKGDWTATWDGLYWRWIWNHVEELGKNPRWAMMCAMAKKMEPDKRSTHLKNAEEFLNQL